MNDCITTTKQTQQNRVHISWDILCDTFYPNVIPEAKWNVANCWNMSNAAANDTWCAILPEGGGEMVWYLIFLFFIYLRIHLFLFFIIPDLWWLAINWLVSFYTFYQPCHDAVWKLRFPKRNKYVCSSSYSVCIYRDESLRWRAIMFT